MTSVKKSDIAGTWAEWFDRRAGYYKDPRMKAAYYIDGKPVPDRFMEAVIDDAWRKLSAGRGDTVLDIGGGAGMFAGKFSPGVKRYVITDISFAMAREGRRLNRKNAFFVCEASMLPFRDDSFDRIICYSVFHYFPDNGYAVHAIKEFKRVVKRGGSILIGDVPMEVKEKAATTKKKRRSSYPARLKHNLKYHYYRPGFFKKACAANGLRCEILAQDIEEKETARVRFDVLIRKRS